MKPISTIDDDVYIGILLDETLSNARHPVPRGCRQLPNGDWELRETSTNLFHNLRPH